MPTFEETAGQIARDIDGSGEKLITYSWPKFYDVCEAQKLHESRKKGIQEALWDEHGLLVAYGEKVVMVARDAFINRVR